MNIEITSLSQYSLDALSTNLLMPGLNEADNGISIPRYMYAISIWLSPNVKSLLFDNILLNAMTLVFPVW